MEFLRSLPLKKIGIILGIMGLMALPVLIYASLSEQDGKDTKTTNKPTTSTQQVNKPAKTSQEVADNTPEANDPVKPKPATPRPPQAPRPANNNRDRNTAVYDDGIEIQTKKVKKGGANYAFERIDTEVSPGLTDHLNTLALTPRGQTIMGKIESITLADRLECGGSVATQGCFLIINHTDSQTGRWLYSTYQIKIKSGRADVFDILAHEMLHAIYQELSLSEKTTINAELTRVYNLYRGDLDRKMANYDFRGQDNLKLHELHSFIGGYVSNIGSTLNTHYNAYFNRESLTSSFYIGLNDTTPDPQRPETITRSPDLHTCDNGRRVARPPDCRHQCRDGTWVDADDYHLCRDYECPNGERASSPSECKIQCRDGTWQNTTTDCPIHQCAHGHWYNSPSDCYHHAYLRLSTDTSGRNNVLAMEFLDKNSTDRFKGAYWWLHYGVCDKANYEGRVKNRRQWPFAEIEGRNHTITIPHDVRERVAAHTICIYIVFENDKQAGIVVDLRNFAE